MGWYCCEVSLDVQHILEIIIRSTYRSHSVEYIVRVKNSSRQAISTILYAPATTKRFNTMSPQPQTGSKKRTKYRPVQRSDGVVVLQRPYRPVGSPLPIPPSFFERYLPKSDDVASTTKSVAADSKPQNLATLTSEAEELASIGTHLVDLGGYVYNDQADAGREKGTNLANAGRGGYQEIFDDRAKPIGGIVDFLRQVAQEGEYPTPMQRFLSEAGSWSALELRGD
jgi:hypothetical protein